MQLQDTGRIQIDFQIGSVLSNDLTFTHCTDKNKWDDHVRAVYTQAGSVKKSSCMTTQY